jgi:hypothetical protein
MWFRLALLGAGLSLLAVGRPFLASSGKAMTDFRTFYFAAQAFREGGNVYDVGHLGSLAEAAGVPEHVFPYVYPPRCCSTSPLWPR